MSMALIRGNSGAWRHTHRREENFPLWSKCCWVKNPVLKYPPPPQISRLLLPRQPSRPVCYHPVLSLFSAQQCYCSPLWTTDICSACVDEGARTLLRGGFWDAGTAPSSYCPVSSARLAFCQPASVELCTLHTEGSSVMSRYVWVSCEISELALTVARAKVKVSTSHLRLPYPSLRPETTAELTFYKPTWISITFLHFKITFLHFKNWHLGRCDLQAKYVIHWSAFRHISIKQSCQT